MHVYDAIIDALTDLDSRCLNLDDPADSSLFTLFLQMLEI
ncbi:hypothetical protein QF042_002695 [Pedobacter sp. W3I1]|nr:hypothetical protein [Pedobacter sp. W3I1]